MRDMTFSNEIKHKRWKMEITEHAEVALPQTTQGT